MKNLIFAFVILSSVTSFANSKTSLKEAADLLSSIAEGSESFKVKPSSDVKAMISDAALTHYGLESKEEFEGSWVGESGDAWGADSTNWGTDTVQGAYGYVTTALSDTREAVGDEEGAEETYDTGMAKAKKAFQILRTLKNVKYGVAPVGAVQCGVTFAALLILDTDSGEVVEIQMEGSGC